jgi:hypothetical protein
MIAPNLRHFSELNEDEVTKMWGACVEAAVDYAESINMGGLSHGGVHDIYGALETAIFDQWRKSRAVMTKTRN